MDKLWINYDLLTVLSERGLQNKFWQNLMILYEKVRLFLLESLQFKAILYLCNPYW